MAHEWLSSEDLNFPKRCSSLDTCQESAFSEASDSKFPSSYFSKALTKERYSSSWEYASRRQAVEQVLKKLWEKELPGKKHIDRYMRHKYRSNFKAKTLLGTFTTVEFFLDFIKKRGKRHLEGITKEDLEAFIEHEQDRGLKISSVRTRLAQLYAFMDFLVESGIVHPDTVARRIKLKLPQSLPRSMDPDDVKRLLSVKGKARDRAMVLVLLRTGMRIGELLNTKVSEVNVKERKIMIYEGEKNRLGRVVYFFDDAHAALKTWLRKRDSQKEYLFYGWWDKPLSYVAARKMFERYLDKAGLPHKGYTLHWLRHTYATELLNAGMPLECLQQLMGHNNVEITRRYARLSDKTREEEYFKAMSIIERGETDGYYQLDSELQKILEEKELLATNREDLYEQT